MTQVQQRAIICRRRATSVDSGHSRRTGEVFVSETHDSRQVITEGQDRHGYSR